MTIQILLALAAGGKTAHAIERIRALLPLSPVRVLVPDQMEAAAFRRRLAQAGGALGTEVQTFYKLYADVLTLAGGTAALPQAEPEQGMARLLPSVRYRLIQHITGTLCDAGQLAYYAPLRHSAGFARLLGALFGELKRARIFPEDLERALAGRKPRLAELARLYTAYQSWLLDTGWVDADGQGWLAAIALEQDPSLLSDLSLLVVDGFDEFNPTQLHLLRLLADRAASTVVTLTGDPQNPDRLAHRRLTRARTALENTLDVEPTPLPDKGHGDKETRRQGDHPLVHIEANLFEPNPLPTPADDTVTFIEAQNRAAEVREALRWLKARLVRDRVPLSDVAIVARDVLPYRPFLEEVAAEFGMPLRFASGADLRTNPAIAALLNLLTLPLEPDDWSPQALLDALTSPYFDWTDCGLQPGDAGYLYEVARAGQVVTGLDQWREAFQHLSARPSDEYAFAVLDEEDLAPRRPLAKAQVARLEAVFEEIAARITPSPQATLRERVLWIEQLIGPDSMLTPSTATEDDDTSLHIVIRARENPATAERDVAALRIFKDILRGLVLADSVLNGGNENPVSLGAPVSGALRGDSAEPSPRGRGAERSVGGEQEANLPLDQFVTELVQAVGETTYTTPVEGEAILVASALEVRGLTFDSVALLGLAEGDFPRAERDDALLRESDRVWLAEQGFAIEPRLQGDEATLFYQAVTRARRRLLLCRPYLADDGQSWEASPYWHAVLRLFEGAVPTHVRPTDPVRDVASDQELASAMPDDGTGVPVTILRARSSTQTDPSPWNGDLSTLEEQLAQRFGADQPWSSSRLETYAKCPFYFWTAYAMELEPRELPQAGFDVLILGSIYHLVLERLYDRVNDGDPDRLRAELPIVARQVYDAAPNDYGFRPTPLWLRQQEEMTETLSRTLDALIEAAGEYKPLIQELPFGLKEKPPLVLRETQGQTLYLRGYIDRVDRAPDGRLRIIDYKAGSTPIPARDLADGHRLQLPLYAQAAQESLNEIVASGFYWHIGSAKPSSLKLEKYDGGVGGAIETATGYSLAIGTAVCTGQFAPASSDDGCPTFCPAATFCERYKSKSW
jgi:ATP-dependent helicase/DNAse subunit B